jgi:hypothetical protein
MFRERMATLHELTAPSHAARRNHPEEEEEEEEEREEEDDATAASAPAASAPASAATTTTSTTRAAEADSESPPDADAFDRRATPRLTPLAALYVQTHVAPLRRIYSWAVPTSEALDAVADAARLAAATAEGGSEEDARRRELPLGAAAAVSAAAAEVVEIGAGTGYWTSLLRRRGVRVAAYDLAPCDGAEPNGHHRLDATAAANTNRVDANASGGGDEKRSRVFETTTTFTFTPPEETAARPNPLHPPPFARIRRGGAASVAAHGVSAALFLCWPPSESEREGFASVSETGARPRPGGSDLSASDDLSASADDLSASAPRAAVATMALDALRAYRGNVVAYAGELPSERASDGARRGGDRTRHPPGGGGGEKGEKGATAGDAFHDALRESFALERRVVLPRWPGANDSLTVWRRKKPRRRPPGDDAANANASANERRAREERRGRGSEGFRGSEYSARDALDDRDGAFGDDDLDASSFSGAAFRDARGSLVRASAAAWEDAVVARVAARRARGAGGARPGFERRAVDAARSRASTLLRRLALFAL